MVGEVEVSVGPVDDVEIWSALCAFLPADRRRALTGARRDRLRARVAEHGADAVVRVGRWVAESKHERAAFLRARGDVDTLLWRSKFQAYAEFSMEPDVDARAIAAFMRWRALTGSDVELSPVLAAPILSAIEAVGAPATIRVIEWVLLGQDDRAWFLRSKGVTSLAGILRADKLHGRVDLANAAKPALAAAQVVTSSAASGSADADEIDLGPNAILGRSPTDHLRRNR